MTIPPLTAAPGLPDRIEQDQTTFDSRMAATWAYLKNDFEPELNLITQAIDLASSTAVTAETNALIAEASAVATANYKGLWSSLTGALNIPASVFHDNKNWQLLQNIADVTSIEPGTNGSYWFDLSVRFLENATASNRTIFNPADTSYIAKARLSDTQTLYVYRGVYYCKAIVATVSESGITFSNEFQVGQSNSSELVSATPLSSTQVAVTWYNTVDYDAYIRVLTYNSGTNTLSAACVAYAYHTQGSPAAIHSACCAISSSKIAIFYNNPSDSGKMYGQVLSWDGSALSVATAAVIVQSYPGDTLIQAELISGSDTDGKIFITYTYATYSYASIANWTSVGGFSVSTPGSEIPSYNNYAPIVVLDSNTVIVFGRYYNSTYGFTFGEIYLYYVGGVSPVPVRKHQFTKIGNSDTVSLSANSATKIAPGKAAVMLSTYAGYEHTLFVFSASAPTDNRNASTLELLTEQTFSRYSNSYFTLSKTADNNLLYAYQDGNSHYGTIEKIGVDL